LGSVGAMTAAAVFTLFKKKRQEMLISLLISFATGTLLTSALVGLIPEALHEVGHEFQIILMIFLIGAIIVFFFLEKLIIWRNCPDEDCEVHGTEASGPIVLLGDALHNFSDGLVIASAFLIDISIGLSVSVAIIAHEIPQETGDFGILLHSGYNRKKAFFYNFLSSSTTIPAAFLGYFLLNFLDFLVPYMLAISAASFLYISLSDLTPELHRRIGLKQSFKQISLIILGIITMLIVILFGPHAH
jgi:zinc and cadmium transporter